MCSQRYRCESELGVENSVRSWERTVGCRIMWQLRTETLWNMDAVE